MSSGKLVLLKWTCWRKQQKEKEKRCSTHSATTTIPSLVSLKWQLCLDTCSATALLKQRKWIGYAPSLYLSWLVLSRWTPSLSWTTATGTGSWPSRSSRSSWLTRTTHQVAAATAARSSRSPSGCDLCLWFCRSRWIYHLSTFHTIIISTLMLCVRVCVCCVA